MKKPFYPVVLTGLFRACSIILLVGGQRSDNGLMGFVAMMLGVWFMIVAESFNDVARTPP